MQYKSQAVAKLYFIAAIGCSSARSCSGSFRPAVRGWDCSPRFHSTSRMVLLLQLC